jgi:ligand-binding SRPBCC domain-containing protein
MGFAKGKADMPVFETVDGFAAPVGPVFGFFLRPANLLLLAPPELHLELLEGPEELHLGARLTLRGRRWGISHRSVTEVTALERDALLVEEQRQGPFRKWVHTHHYEALPGGETRVRETIEYEPPGGILGLRVTAQRIEADLAWVFGYRRVRARELVEGGGV